MKILIVLDSLGTGGAQRLKLQLAQGLVERGHEVEIFIYVSEDQFFASYFEDSELRYMLQTDKAAVSHSRF